MKVDDTILRILHEIKEEIKEEKGIEISVKEIGKIIHSQFEGAFFAMGKGVEARLDNIGCFKRGYKSEIIEGKLKLKELKKTLSAEELAVKELEMKMAKIARYKKLHGNKRMIELEELLNIESEFKLESRFNKLKNNV